IGTISIWPGTKLLPVFFGGYFVPGHIEIVPISRNANKLFAEVDFRHRLFIFGRVKAALAMRIYVDEVPAIREMGNDDTGGCNWQYKPLKCRVDLNDDAV